MIGELRPTPKGWAVTPPSECINGHPLGPGEVLVGNEPCTCQGGHMGWTCRRCGETFLWPPESPVCTVLNGPGVNRPAP